MPPDDAQATEIKAWLRERPEVEAILPGGRADTQIGGAPIEVLGLADHATYRDHWPLLESTRECLEPASARRRRFVSEQLARRLKLPSATALKCRRQAATGRWRWSASMPITATPKARSPSISPR